MSLSKRLLVFCCVSLAITACGKSDHSNHAGNQNADVMEGEKHGESMSHTSLDGAEGVGSGTVSRVLDGGRFLMIDHNPIDAIGMGAMNMGFELAEGVAAEDIEAGDSVEFAVRVDGSNYLIDAICEPAIAGVPCLNDKTMSH